jgi:hypothetical protein
MFRNSKVLPAAILLAAVTLMPGIANAQVSNQWQYGGQIYAFLPKIDGTANFPPVDGGVGVSLNSSDVLDALKFAFFGSLEAKKGHWGAFTDVMYANLGDNKSGIRDFTIGGNQIPGTASASVNLDVKTWAWTIAGQYVAIAQPGLTLDVFAGTRMLDLATDINWGIDGAVDGIPVGGRTGARSNGDTNWDFIIGTKGRVRFGADNRWFVPYYLDVGAGQSDLTWQAMAGLGYSWQSVDFFVAYRYLDYDLGESKPFEDLSLAGPVFALVFRW